MLEKKKPKPPENKGKKYVKLSDGMIEKLRDEYVQGIDTPDGRQYPTTKALAARHQLNERIVEKKCTDLGWADQRAVFEAKLKEDSDNEKRREMIDQAVEFDSNNLNLAKNLQGEIGMVIRAARNARQLAVTRLEQPILNGENTNNRTEITRDERERARAEKTLLGIHPNNITALANGLATTQKVGRLAYGDSTENHNVKSSGDTQSELEEAFNLIDGLVSRNPDSLGGGKLH